MKESKNEKLLVLYEAIGEIDPHVATAALKYKHKTNIKSIRLVIVLAACICILAATLIVGMNLALGGAKGEDPGDKNLAEDAENALTEEAEDVTLSADGTQPEWGVPDIKKDLENLLNESKAVMTAIDDSEVDTVLYNGRLSLMLSDGAKLYFKAFENVENAEALKDSLSVSGELLGGAETLKYKVWISFGDGRVVTPYLEYSEENIFYGILFDYSPKVLPSDEFVTELINLFENN